MSDAELDRLEAAIIDLWRRYDQLARHVLALREQLDDHLPVDIDYSSHAHEQRTSEALRCVESLTRSPTHDRSESTRPSPPKG